MSKFYFDIVSACILQTIEQHFLYCSTWSVLDMFYIITLNNIIRRVNITITIAHNITKWQRYENTGNRKFILSNNVPLHWSCSLTMIKCYWIIVQLSYKYEYIAYLVDALTINDCFAFRIRLQSHVHRWCILEVNTVLGSRLFDQSL